MLDGQRAGKLRVSLELLKQVLCIPADTYILHAVLKEELCNPKGAMLELWLISQTQESLPELDLLPKPVTIVMKREPFDAALATMPSKFVRFEVVS